MSTEFMIVMGDFNVVWKSIDRLNVTMVSDAKTEDFEFFFASTSLVKAKSSSSFYSWSKVVLVLIEL